MVTAGNHVLPATYYDPNGGFGACGSLLQNLDLVVALGKAHYDDGSHCGETISVGCETPPPLLSRCITTLIPGLDNGQSITVTVADLCPDCQGDNGIDLSEAAMALLDSNYVQDGVITVNWAFQ